MIRKREKTIPRWKSSLIVNFLISIIVDLPLRGCPLRCFVLISRTNEREALFQCGGFLDMQIGMQPLLIDWAKEEAKIIRHIYVCC